MSNKESEKIQVIILPISQAVTEAVMMKKLINSLKSKAKSNNLSSIDRTTHPLRVN